MSECIEVLHPPRKRQLKEAFREDVRLAGGQCEVSRYTGRGQQRISKWGGENTSAFPPLDAIHDLTEVITGLRGVPNTIRVMCELAGGVFVPLPGAPDSPDTPELMLVRLAAEVGDVSRVIAEDLADDGKINTPGVASKAIREINECLRVLVQLRRGLEPIANRGR